MKNVRLQSDNRHSTKLTQQRFCVPVDVLQLDNDLVQDYPTLVHKTTGCQGEERDSPSLALQDYS